MKRIEFKEEEIRKILMSIVQTNPDGFKGFDKVRMGLKLIESLEAAEGKTSFDLEDAQFVFLKGIAEQTSFLGIALKNVEKMIIALEQAEEISKE